MRNPLVAYFGIRRQTMIDRVERELELDAAIDDVWEALTADGLLAAEVHLDLRPGGDAEFRFEESVKTGWIEEALAPARLTFWWATGDEPASRVELALEEIDECRTRLRVVETRPLELLELVGVPLTRVGGASFGPALVAA
jgi:uncharacterized protein YndB with AHSA1/START domain